jgi:hypothetical protein
MREARRFNAFPDCQKSEPGRWRRAERCYARAGDRFLATLRDLTRAMRAAGGRAAVYGDLLVTDAGDRFDARWEFEPMARNRIAFCRLSSVAKVG